MSLVGVFLARDQLRPIWRFFLSVMVCLAALVVAGELLKIAFALLKFRPTVFAGAFWGSLAGLVLILAGFKVMTAVFDQRPLGSMGLAFHSRWWKELACGLAVGAAMLGIAVVPEWLAGLAKFTLVPHPAPRTVAFFFALFAVAAALEETTFRGYPFQRLAEAMTPTGAVAVTSAMFGLAHLANPHRSWVSTFNTALVGVPFCIAYLRTRALWLPIGIHFIWNFLMGVVMGLPVSGIELPPAVLTAHVSGPVWLTGGAYGPEGGLLAMAAILAGTLYLSFAKSIYTSDKMKALVSASVDSRWLEPPVTILPPPPETEERKDRP